MLPCQWNNPVKYLRIIWLQSANIKSQHETQQRANLVHNFWYVLFYLEKSTHGVRFTYPRLNTRIELDKPGASPGQKLFNAGWKKYWLGGSPARVTCSMYLLHYILVPEYFQSKSCVWLKIISFDNWLCHDIDQCITKSTIMCIFIYPTWQIR